MKPLALDQPDLFRPAPMISGKTNMSGRDIWYCRRRMVWTIDVEDLFLTDVQLLTKYGPAFEDDGSRLAAGLSQKDAAE